MPEYPPEKQSPAPRLEYEGLEVDTRAGDGLDKHLDHTKPLPDLRKWQEEEDNRHYLDEKQMIQSHEVQLLKMFRLSDVVAGSPLNVVAHEVNGTGPRTGTADSRQVFRAYYQSVLGNIKETVAIGGGTWQSARPIFTDAINNTGLATVTYLNSSAPWGQMFYVGSNGYLQEKRVPYNNVSAWWEPGTLNPSDIKMVGNISLPDKNPNKDPINQFDSYRMAAVYSENFSNGAETRLFFHRAAANGTTWVQEWIWTKKRDDWQIGQAITNVYPNSHLAATVDERHGLLRLYFSSGNLTLQEVWLNITDPKSIYNNGFYIPKFLPQNNADLAATSLNGTTYIYHPSNIGELGVRELIVSGLPVSLGSSSFSQESFNLSEPLVARPTLTSMEGTSPYQPLGAAVSTVDLSQGPQITVLWADQVTGHNLTSEGSVAGYSRLQSIGKLVDSAVWDDNIRLTVPLGSSNSYPEKSSRRRRWLARM
ncbi:MAG: hypothetical protein Q9208_004690 [Pyrenodesmia sp. 3 TL-2023]